MSDTLAVHGPQQGRHVVVIGRTGVDDGHVAIGGWADNERARTGVGEPPSPSIARVFGRIIGSGILFNRFALFRGLGASERVSPNPSTPPN